jgi:uncharacterized protein YcsI (UPF0317 family)
MAPGYVQANLAIVDRSEAYDLLLYCQRNARACPVLEVTETGDPEPRLSAPWADLRTDLPRYAVYRNGQRVADQREVRDLWTPSSVAFLIGSGMSVDRALERAGVPTDRHRWVLRTKAATIPAGRFRGPLAVTMRWLRPVQALIAVRITARYPQCHGAPIHIGDPDALGADLERPLFGPAVPPIPPDLVPVFWACGVTPQEAALASGLPLVIAHAPGHGFITDLDLDRVAAR